MTAEAAARIAFKATMRGTHIVVPGLVNKIFTFVVGILPIRYASNLVRFINRQRGQDQ
jgi:hypothetical protein